MRRGKKEPTKPLSSDIADQSQSGEPRADEIDLRSLEVDDVDPVDEEITEFLTRRPVTCAIAGHCSKLMREASKLPDGSPEHKKLMRRFRKLEPYIGACLYNQPKAKRDGVVLAFCQSLISGQFTRRGRRFKAWEDVKELTDRFAKDITKRPVGNPVLYRFRIAEALDIKLVQPDRTWRDIFEQMEDELRIPFEDFSRQIQLLRRLLREEGIGVPQLGKLKPSIPPE